jgi:hypothetical protein
MSVVVRKNLTLNPEKVVFELHLLMHDKTIRMGPAMGGPWAASSCAGPPALTLPDEKTRPAAPQAVSPYDRSTVCLLASRKMGTPALCTGHVDTGGTDAGPVLRE